MWNQFYLENLHFAVSLFTGLVFFAASWLYFDAWLGLGAKSSLGSWFGQKRFREGLRAFGFLFLAVSFAAYSSWVETSLLPNYLNQSLVRILVISTRLAGYLLVILSLLMDPLQPRPQTAGLTRESFGSRSSVLPALPGSLRLFDPWLLPPFLALACCLLYFRKAYFGLERHLKGIAKSFAILSAYEFVNLASLFQNTASIDLYGLVAPFGPVWLLGRLLLLAAALMLGKWVFGYLLKQLQTQLMMILTALVLSIFLLTTVVFTSVLLKNVQEQSLEQLQRSAKVLNLALETKKDQLLSESQSVARDPGLRQALSGGDNKALARQAQDQLVGKKLASLIVTDPNGQVLTRGEDADRIGDSISSNPLTQQAFKGQSATSVVAREGVLSPVLSLQAVSPVLDSHEQVVGTVLLTSDLDNTFIANVKKQTGLEASVYKGDTLAATTLKMPDNKSQAVGVMINNPLVSKQVLASGRDYKGPVSILNRGYFGAFLPLKDIQGKNLGMLFVGQPQTDILFAAGIALELTFGLAALVIVLSLIPITLVARYIAYQLK